MTVRAGPRGRSNQPRPSATTVTAVAEGARGRDDADVAAVLARARVGLVHERLTELGGSEAVVEQLAAICPGARLFVPVADPGVRPPGLAAVPIATSGLQRLYPGGGRYAHLLPLLPWAMRRADLSDLDVVVVSHHAFAQRVRPPAGVPLVSYVHTPARWIWQAGMRTGEGGRLGEAGLAAFAATQRRPDRLAAGRVDTLVANSTAVAARIRAWWGREALVVHPPVDVETYRPDPAVPREDFVLLAGRLVPYKRPEVAVAAARAAGRRLVVAGDGRSRAECEAVAAPGTEFLGRVDTATLRDLFRRCRALVFPGEEDFGIVPVEAQACGAPVVALGTGGAVDTVLPGVTGRLVDPALDPVAGFAAALDELDRTPAPDPDVVRAHAETFSVPRFRERMSRVIVDVLRRHGRA